MGIMSDVLDDPFHAIAFEAMIIEARKVGTWPDSEKVKQTAYKLYEEQRNG
jgi:hypothetical protein